LECFWSQCCCSKPPPITRQGLYLFGQEITLSDEKARKDIGYTSHVSVDVGLKELSEDFEAQQSKK